MSEYICVPLDRAGLELDEFLCLLYPHLGKGYWRGQVRAGAVLLDGQRVLPAVHLRADQVVIIDVDEEAQPAPPVAPAERVPILYEDDHVLVVDKPAGLATEPERWARSNASLAGALLELSRVPDGAEDDPLPTGSFRPRIVHRIDKDTSGALVVAKDLDAERVLRGAFESGGIDKAYLALVEGEHPLGEGESEVIDRPLASDERKSGRMRAVTKGGKASRTRISVAERFRGFTLLRCEPLTGRTHQIRVHLSDMGFPLVVDRFYGRRDAFFLSEFKSSYRPKKGQQERPLIGRLTLHAWRLGFDSPSGERVDVEAPIPGDFTRALKQLRKVRPLS